MVNNSVKDRFIILCPASFSERTNLIKSSCSSFLEVFLELTAGDTLEWQMTDTPNGRTATVRKAK
jgi:hypothetical protein